MEKLLINGLTLAYERCGAGRPLVLLHGFPLDHTVWQALAALLEDDFDVIMPDVYGFGASTLLEEASMDDMAAGVLALLTALGIDSAYIAGHSMGGYIALSFARQFPQQVRGLALIGSQAAADIPERKAGRYVTAQQVMQNGVEVVLDMAGKLTLNPGLVASLQQIILRQRPAGIAAALGAMAGRIDSTEHLSGFRFPVLLVHGVDDNLISVERARDIKKQLPQASLLELQGVGHSPMLEAPEETAQAMRMLFK